MERKIRTALMALSVVLLSSCGGGSSSLDIEGAWKGSYSLKSEFSQTPLYALIRTDGPTIMYDSTGLIYVVTDTPTSSEFDANALVYAPYGFIFTGQNPTIGVIVKATASNTDIDGNLTLDAGVAPFQLSRLTASSGTPSVVAGVWSGAYFGSKDVGFQVSADGVIAGSDALGCSFTGKITQVSAGEDLFDVALTSTGPKPVCGHSFTGLAYESGTDELSLFGGGAGTYYYIAAYDDLTQALTAELKVQ